MPSATRLERVSARVGRIAASPAGRRVARIASPAIGIAMLALLAWQVSRIGWATFGEAWPTSPLFYLVFLVGYLSPIAAEVVIYRRLWGISGRELAPMFLKKRVMNESLVGYSGEAYALWWAAQRPRGRFGPLDAVKDNNVVSAVAGNVATFALLAATLLFADGTRLAVAAVAVSGHAVAIALVLLGVVVAVLVSRPRLLTLPPRELRFITAVHVARVLLGVALMIALWKVALPEVAITLWLALAAWRGVFSALPFVPNRELLFVNLAILALGAAGHGISALLAVTAALTIIAHLMVAVWSVVIASGVRRSVAA